MITSSRGRKRRKRQKRKGAALVEFALIAPLFFTLILGIVEVGRMLMVQQLLVNAAREGARASVMPGETDAQVTTVVSNAMSAAGVSGYTETLSPTEASGPSSGTTMTLTITVPASTVSWLGTGTWFSGSTLSASVAMAHE
jgi:Flp pilus assembly protein TadG